MAREDDLHLRIGRISDRGAGRRPKPFVGRVIASAQKAGGLYAGRRRGTRSTFGRGQPAAFLATRSLTDRSRRVVVNADASCLLRQQAVACLNFILPLLALGRNGLGSHVCPPFTLHDEADLTYGKLGGPNALRWDLGQASCVYPDHQSRRIGFGSWI